MTMPVKMGKTPLINASAEAIVPYRALLTPGTCLRMVLFSGERDDWAKLLPTVSCDMAVKEFRAQQLSYEIVEIWGKVSANGA
jgi:hypothetical protein